MRRTNDTAFRRQRAGGPGTRTVPSLRLELNRMGIASRNVLLNRDSSTPASCSARILSRRQLSCGNICCTVIAAVEYIASNIDSAEWSS